MLENLNLNIGESLKNSAISNAIKLGQDALGNVASSMYQLPKKVEPPPIQADEDKEHDGYTDFDETPRLLPPSPVVENVKRSEKELEHRATNKAKMYSELLSILQSASSAGFAFASLKKGDRAYLDYWNEEIDKAELEGLELALPSKYYEVKARIEAFEQEILSIQSEKVGDDITDMLYESFLYDLQQKNKDNNVTPLSPWEAVGQAVIIVLGNTAKMGIFRLVLNTLSRKNNA